MNPPFTQPSSEAWTLLLIGAVLLILCGAGLVGWWIARRTARIEAAAERALADATFKRDAANQAAQAVAQAQARADVELATLRERLRATDLELADASDALHHARDQLEHWRGECDSARDERTQLSERAALMPTLTAQLTAARSEVAQLAAECAESKARLAAERAAAHDKLALLADAKEALSNQFKTLANEILEEKSRRFAEQNRAGLDQLLGPLKNRLHEFQGKVEQLYDTEGKERSALGSQVQHLMQLNRTLSDDAKNLTDALRGSNKSQGNWGELILERVLEASGLRAGHEYQVQPSHTREDGSKAQPDVVLHLPQGRRLVIDAKVSLIAYEEMFSAQDDGIRAAARRRHLDSLKKHMAGLSVRNYQLLYGIESLDFVLLFVPIEPAFLAAVQADDRLFMEAWDRNVLLVSPSTLLFVVRTVAHLWRQEQQGRNAQEIARRGAELYDKLAGFVADLEKVGRNLALAQDAWTQAFDKLGRGRGNLIRQAEQLKTLGVQPSRSLPDAVRRSADEALDDESCNDSGVTALDAAAPIVLSARRNGSDGTEPAARAPQSW